MAKGCAILMVLGAALAVFEFWRLSTPATAEFTETWTFQTPAGPRDVVGTYRLSQGAAIPYLPGGSVGRTSIVGNDLVVDTFGQQYYAQPLGPMLLHQLMRNQPHGVAPALNLDGLKNEYTTGFVRRIMTAGTQFSGNVELMPPHFRRSVSLSRTQRATSGLATVYSSDVPSLADLESDNPGVRLVRVTIKVKK